jgi:hypothetical protein
VILIYSYNFKTINLYDKDMRQTVAVGVIKEVTRKQPGQKGGEKKAEAKKGGKK